MSAGGDDGPAVFDSAELLVRLADVDAELPGDEHIEIAVIGGAAITFPTGRGASPTTST